MALTNKKRNVSKMQDSDILEQGDEQMVEETPVIPEKKARRPRITVKTLQDIELSDDDKEKLIKQVGKEFDFATRGLQEWIDTNLERLKLYNNQAKAKDVVSEPLLFTHINTWLASLYDDEYSKVWKGRESSDIVRAQNLTQVAEYDYELMDKAELDLFLLWDALFFSYGVYDMLEFDSDRICPSPSIIDPLCFYYDTLASSIDGNVENKGGMRFLGWDLYMTEKDIEDSNFMFSNALTLIKQVKEVDKTSNIEKAREERMKANGGNSALIEKEMGDNNMYQVLQWRTWWKGQKVVLVLDADRKELLGAKILPVDGHNKSLSWFVGAKRFNIQPHQFKGMSLPDMLEDKQRKKAVLLNDALNLTRATVYGNYAYNSDMIKNENDLKWGYGKFIPVSGNPANVIMPINKDGGNQRLLDSMLSYLDTSAQSASATPSLQQGVLSDQQRTLGELQMVSDSSKTRYSLALKTFALGDSDFWKLWYLSYKVNYRYGLSTKVARISGTVASYKEMNREDIICDTDPDLTVTSKSLEEARNLRRFTMFTKVLELVVSDQDADKRYAEKYGMTLASIPQDEIDMLLPPTSDELIARDQNAQMDRGEIPEFLENDNHVVHIREHMKAQDGTIKWNHIKLHIDALKKIQKNPNLTPNASTGMQTGETAPVTAQGGQTALPMPNGMNNMQNKLNIAQG